MQYFPGLSDHEVTTLRQRYGKNELIGSKRLSLISRFALQFKSLLILLLFVASLVSLLAGEIVDSIFILIIVFLNAFLGFYQEYRAERAVEALKKLTVSTVRAIRDGHEIALPSIELLPGDIVLLDEGSRIPTDGEILESTAIEVDESALTGESQSVAKLPHAKADSLVFLGTQVVRGHGVIRVLKIGMDTRFGGITRSLSAIQDEPTPLQSQLSELGKVISLLAAGTSVALFIIGYFRGFDVLTLFLTSVSLAVAAIPEGLPAIVTITLGLGVARMASKKTLVRRLASIETLGSTQIICTDKTGTLTTNNMRVRSFFKLSTAVSDSEVAKAVSVCNTANIIYDSEGAERIAGDTTEGALLYWVSSLSLSYELFRSDFPIQLESPFDSVKKRMSVVIKDGDVQVLYIKGAPEVIIPACEITESERSSLDYQLNTMASQGLRTIAVARRIINYQIDIAELEHEPSQLEFLALFGIADPPRAEVKEAIERARMAGVETVMITGDNPITAQAIGTEIGLLRPGELVFTGETLNSTSDEALLEKIHLIRIFSRTTPEDKLRIVSTLQRKGYTVAATGDGVNDALALKKANIGISMGMTGTDVAKEASDMVLLDDNYSTIIAAIEEGRRIYRNIVKAVYYLLACNLSEVLVIAIAILLFRDSELPLIPIQVLWINLVTDGLPALALAIDPVESRTMHKKPRPGNSAIIDRADYPLLTFIALGCAAITLFSFWLGLHYGNIHTARTYAFCTIVVSQCVSILLLRRSSPLTNPLLLGILIATILLQFTVVSLPFTQDLFQLR